ncbi:MarR family winged helix-turn-helix transcriptional regulator [Roseospirillum parvum]|uniref:DNA-binding transcriptional regulator, MarR family n=1 Tax=Roseospirillum parvum TaxID=83401 RepID=A0A1G7X314_9PROT|nr:MarR family winged helix-turn-helix transcriptional regulator [Roseospirillum parvum]SDG78579.1 DNA-binding transcriptional regulator, MarR family [Roseospirillum parvum]
MDRIPLPIEPDQATGRLPFAADYLAYLLARASHLISRHFHAHLAERGVPVSEWRVLGILSHGEGMTVGELARLGLFKQPTLTKLLDRLEDQGLVRRRPCPDDRRKVGLVLTGAGRALVDELMVEARRHEDEVLAACVGDTPVAGLKADVRRLIVALEGRVAPRIRAPSSCPTS